MNNLCERERSIKILGFLVNADQKVHSAEEEFHTQVDRMILPCTVGLFSQLFMSVSNGPMTKVATLPKWEIVMGSRTWTGTHHG